jgi:hypothetical protein
MSPRDLLLAEEVFHGDFSSASVAHTYEFEKMSRYFGLLNLFFIVEYSVERKQL